MYYRYNQCVSSDGFKKWSSWWQTFLMFENFKKNILTDFICSYIVYIVSLYTAFIISFIIKWK